MSVCVREKRERETTRDRKKETDRERKFFNNNFIINILFQRN